MPSHDIYTKVKVPFSEISTKNVHAICGDDKEDLHKLFDKTKLLIDESIKIDLYPEGVSFTTAQTWWRSNSKRKQKAADEQKKNVVRAIIIDYKPESLNSVIEEYKAHYIIINIDYIRFIHKIMYDTFPVKISKLDMNILRNSIMTMKTELRRDILVHNIWRRSMGDIELPHNYRRITLNSASALNISIKNPLITKQSKSLLVTNNEAYDDVYFYMNIPFERIKNIEVGSEIHSHVVDPILVNQEEGYILIIQS